MTLIPLSNLKGDPGIGSQGNILTPTDLATIRGRDAMGSYAIRHENIIDPPVELSGNPLWFFEVGSNGTNSELQRLWSAGHAFFRIASSASAMGPWRRIVEGADLEGLIPNTRGTITTPTDIDALRTPDAAGT